MKSIVKFRNTLALLMLGVVFLCGSLAYAESGKGSCGQKKHAHQFNKGEFFQELGLTEEQQALIGEHQKICHTQKKESYTQLKNAKKQFKDELSKYKSDPAEVARLAFEIKKLQAQLIDQRIASISKVKEILTIEQFSKFQEKIKAKKESWKEQKKKCLESKEKGSMKKGSSRSGGE